MKKILVAVALSLLGSFAEAQEATKATKLPPATKLEAFSARTSIVIIRAFTTVGVVNGMGRVTIDAREFRDASNPKIREYGIAVTVKESGRLELENTSFIDYEEIDSLIRGIDYIAKVDKSVTSMNDFEAHYKTKGDFSITTFSSRGGEISVAVSSGRFGETSAYLKLSDLGQIKSLIADAKAKIDAAKAAEK